CGPPPNLTFAELPETHKQRKDFPVGHTVSYSCQPGYMRNPRVSPTLTCLPNHTWSEAGAFCQRKQCKSPGRARNGRDVLIHLLFGSAKSHT
ncbi:DAF factor, partial [Bucco capensis]|nr:DAF factor [Bucco capensis]